LSLTCAGEYQNYIKKLYWSNPGLGKPDPANVPNGATSSLTPGNAKVVLLESAVGGGCRFETRPFKDNEDLKNHFADRVVESIEERNRRRVYIVEGLAQDYIATIGGHFFMDPSFFLRQERTCPWSNSFTPTSDALPPPSSLDPAKMFLLQYCELRQFDVEMENNPCFCKRTGRHVGMATARRADKTTAAILRRKVSWWCKDNKDGSWDGMETLFWLFAETND
jgi:hypothetical protein